MRESSEVLSPETPVEAATIRHVSPAAAMRDGYRVRCTGRWAIGVGR